MRYMAWLGVGAINTVLWAHILIILDAISPRLERAVLWMAVMLLTQLVAWKVWQGRWSF